MAAKARTAKLTLERIEPWTKPTMNLFSSPIEGYRQERAERAMIHRRQKHHSISPEENTPSAKQEMFNKAKDPVRLITKATMSCIN